MENGEGTEIVWEFALVTIPGPLRNQLQEVPREIPGFGEYLTNSPQSSVAGFYEDH